MLYDLKGYDMIVVETYEGKGYEFDIHRIDKKVFFTFEHEKRLIKSIIMKPNPIIEYADGVTITFTQKLASLNKSISLVKDCYIDEEDLNLLTDLKVFNYSYITGELFNLPVKKARDYQYHKTDFKRTKNKELVLTRYKNNMFQ